MLSGTLKGLREVQLAQGLDCCCVGMQVCVDAPEPSVLTLSWDHRVQGAFALIQICIESKLPKAEIESLVQLIRR